MAGPDASHFRCKESPLKNPFVITLALALLSPTAALAHAHLLEERPAANATVTAAPTVLSLKFSEAISLKFSGIKLSGPDEAEIGLGAAALDPSDDARLAVPVVGTLAPAEYAVTWHALSSDGHKTSGTYVFTVK